MAKKPFSSIFSQYKTYDPQAEGYGDVQSWAKSFDDRMGIEEATTRVGKDNPLSILGLKVLPATLALLKKAYHKLIMQNQECQRADATPQQQEHIKSIIAAYTVLADRISRLTGA